MFAKSVVCSMLLVSCVASASLAQQSDGFQPYMMSVKEADQLSAFVETSAQVQKHLLKIVAEMQKRVRQNSEHIKSYDLSKKMAADRQKLKLYNLEQEMKSMNNKIDRMIRREKNK